MSRPRVDLTELPMPRVENNRLVWRRSEVANFRRVLAGQPTKTANPAADDTKLVTVEELAKLLDMHPRTIRRRVADAQAQAARLEKLRGIFE